MCAKTYPDKTTEQVFEYFDYLANLISNWACTGINNVTKPLTATPTQHVGIKDQLAVEDDINAKLTTFSNGGFWHLLRPPQVYQKRS